MGDGYSFFEDADPHRQNACVCLVHAEFFQPIVAKRLQAAVRYPRTPKIEDWDSCCISVYYRGADEAEKGVEGCRSPFWGL